MAGAGARRPSRRRDRPGRIARSICYVPWPVLAGYGLGYGLGDGVERLRRAAGLRQDAALFAAILAVAALAFIGRTWARAWLDHCRPLLPPRFGC
jgi:hypothetical protein